MRFGFFGDVVGRSGRDGLAEHLPGLRRRLGLEFVIVNAENAAAGFGITEATARELFDAGADCLTLGNHSWDQKEALTYIVREPRLIRPLNYPALADAPGRGAQLFETQSGRRILVVNLLGRVHMDSLDDPFAAVDKELEACPLGAVADAVVVDIHAEPDPAERHRLPDRRGRVRRLRQRDRQPEGGAAAAVHHPHLRRQVQAGGGSGHRLRRLRRDRSGDRPGPAD
jgi:calcineurin-like phosphoesterase